MPQETHIPTPELTIYIAYAHLPISAMAELTDALSQLSRQIVVMHAELARVSPGEFPELEVVSVHTGESIKFTFGEGWLPSVSSNEEDDIIINVPRKLGIPLLVAYLILGAAHKAQEMYNTHLDNTLKELEIRLKQSELQKSVLASPAQRTYLQEQGERVVMMFQSNTVYQIVEVNNISILPGTEFPAKNPEGAP
jgi:hypothetical protein